MNDRRVILAAAAATVVDFVYGFLVYGTLLTSSFAGFPHVYRTSSTLAPTVTAVTSAS